MLEALNAFFTTFKAAVFVPVFIFVIALAMGVKPKKAFFSALSAGVGLEGFSLVIGTYSPILSPIIDNLTNSMGINLPIVDLGWQTTSIIAYSYQIGMIYIAVAIALQIILYLIHFTTIFQAGDLWNNYSYFCWGACLFVLTGNFWLSMVCMIVQQLYTLLCTEIIAKRWSTYYKYPNCTIASLHTATCGVMAVPLNLLFDKLGLYKVQIDPDTLRKKLGFIGEPMTLGLFLGLFIGIVGDFNKLGELATWGEITTCGYGEAATLITGILLMPTTLIISFILPGNLTLPMLDLVAIPYIIQPFVACSNGNILKSFLGGLIFMVLNLYMCTLTCDAFTQVAVSTGVDLQGSTMVTSLVILGQPVGALIFLAFLSQNFVIIGAVIVLYVVCYVLVHKNMAAIHEFIENSALNHTIKKVEAAPAE